MAKIIYIGESNQGSNAYLRAMSLLRLGHEVVIHDPKAIVHKEFNSPFLSAIHFRSGYRLLQPKMQKWVSKIVEEEKYADIVWVNSGELLGKQCLKKLQSLQCPIVLYNNDDPTGGRDGRRFDMLLKALPYYTLCAVLREINKEEYKALGAKKVIRVLMSYDEVIHKPFSRIEDIDPKYRSEVAFIGTWMRHEKRDEFLLELIRQGVPVSIWGGRWSKSPHWKQLEPYYRGGALGGRNYVAALQGAKICLGLLSKGNRDLHTRRSVEVPYAGGLLCAERTSEHQEMYQEGVEAVFWSDATECAAICKKLLADDNLREKIRLAGMQKVRALEVGNEDICRKILEAVAEEQVILQKP
ncbi:CgeB family protein [Larkinella arboricola]